MSPFSLRAAATTFAAAAVCSMVPPLRAQDTQALETRLSAMQASYESRIAALESEVARLRTGALVPADAALSAAVDATVMGIQRGSIASPRRANPLPVAIGVSGDFVLSASGRRDSFESDNQFLLRSVELGFEGRIDPHVKYTFVLAAREDTVEIEDAFADWDHGMPDTFTLRAGRMPVEFGFAAPRHDHELGFVDKPYAVQEFLGGRAVTTGLALHHWFGLGDVPVRWSLGTGNALDGDSHAIQGPLAGHAHQHGTGEQAEPFGRRGLEDFIWTARIASTIDLAEHDALTIGVSAIHAPREQSFFFADPPTNTTVAAGATDRFVTGLDLFWRHNDPASEGRFTLGGEWLWSRRSSADESTLPPRFSGLQRRADGGYLLAEYGLDPHWSVGARYEHFRHEEDRDLATDAFALALTWTIDEFHRLRLECGLIDDELALDSFGFCMLQWTTMLGSHSHGIAW